MNGRLIMPRMGVVAYMLTRADNRGVQEVSCGTSGQKVGLAVPLWPLCTGAL